VTGHAEQIVAISLRPGAETYAEDRPGDSISPRSIDASIGQGFWSVQGCPMAGLQLSGLGPVPPVCS